MKQIKILSGVSGSGKSHLAAKLRAGEDGMYSGSSIVCSADDYFEHLGEYKFDPSKLSEAHGACFRKFIEGMLSQTTHIIIDNTNTEVHEISGYYLGAMAYGYEPEVISILAPYDFERCQERNQHGVPLHVVAAQRKRLIERKLPRYWNARTVEAQF